MKAYIQQKNSDWLNQNAYIAQRGLYTWGYDIIPFEAVDAKAPDVVYENDDILFGGIPVVLDAFDKMGIKRPPTVNYPKSLQNYLGRETKLCNLSEIRSLANGEVIEPVFIKPSILEKDFTGFVFKSFLDLLNISHLEGDINLWKSEVVDFISEYRIYYLDNKIIGCHHYKGDSLVFPDSSVVSEMFYSYKDRFVSGSIDVGITKGRRTLLVEVNDVYALGNYGLNELLYAKMIISRWNELRNAH